MTTREMAKMIDRRAVLRLNGLGIPVTITDVRVVYGRTDFLVKPLAGSGDAWFCSDSVHGIALEASE